MSMNAHRVFMGPSGADHYLAALTIDEKTERKLRAVRDVLREALRDGLRSWPTRIRADELFEKSMVTAAPSVLQPKFRMQGSFAYHTVNLPEHQPPQEIDLDDGVFLPVSFLSQNGKVNPVVMSRGYFSAVERILMPVCKHRGWKLITDKASCVRVQVTPDAHVDLALYAIADEPFSRLIEKAALAKSLNSQQRQSLEDSIELMEDAYRDLSENEIMLAHREEGWKPSDPRKLDDWIRDAVSRHGPQLRRLCRYVKGWRDFQWPKSRLASIALMSAVVTVFDRASVEFDDSRDDRALLKVAQELPGILAGEISNPVVDGQRLDEGWTSQERSDYVIRARELVKHVQAALDGTNDVDAALARLKAAFGQRIPDDKGLILVMDVVAAPVVLTAGLLRSVGAEPAVRDAVQKHGSNRFG